MREAARCLLGCLVAGLMAVTAGCASVPTGGHVLSGRADDRDQPVNDPYVRIIPVGPGRGWDESTIVTAFLTASAGFEDGHKVAREYLAPKVEWRPGVSTIVYDGSLTTRTSRISAEESSVTVSGTQLGRIGADGQYLAGEKRVEEVFRLRKNAQGQWRIAELPDNLTDGMLLSRQDVNRAFRTLNLYFFAPDTSVLVPNPVFLPLVNRRGLSVQLTRQLLSGPTSWLKPAVKTTFPRGTTLLHLGIDDDTVTVDLSEQARAGDLRTMSAQLMWTLRQLPEVHRMRLKIAGKPVHVPGVSSGEEPQEPQDWAAYDPDGIGANTTAYFRTRQGRLASLIGGKPTVLPGKLEVDKPAVSYDQRQVAALDPTGHRLTITDLSTGETETVVEAKSASGTFTTPSWDRWGNVWTVESHGNDSRLWVITGEKKRSIIEENWRLSDHKVTALRVARDGTRVAAVVQVGKHSEVRIGRIDEAAGHLRAEGFIAINSELKDVTDVAWRDADDLAVLGSTPGNPSALVYNMPVSGAPVRPMGGPGGAMTSIAAAPGGSLLVGARLSGKDSPGDKVCALNRQYAEWQCRIDGSAPAYPG